MHHARGTIIKSTTPMEPKHDHSVEIGRKSHDMKLEISHDINLGFNSELDRIAHAKYWDEEYRSVWGKLPGERLSAAEFAKRYRTFQSWVRACVARNCPLAWRVDFVRRHYREERRRQRAKEMECDVEPNLQAQFDEWARRRSVASSVTPPSVGRNEPCPCGSGRKFKKCCGR